MIQLNCKLYDKYILFIDIDSGTRKKAKMKLFCRVFINVKMFVFRHSKQLIEFSESKNMFTYWKRNIIKFMLHQPIESRKKWKKQRK